MRARTAVVAVAALILAACSGEPSGDDPIDASDPELQPLVDDCSEGDMEACDELYFSSEVGSAEEEYGDTCGGRQPADTGELCAEQSDDDAHQAAGDDDPSPSARSAG